MNIKSLFTFYFISYFYFAASSQDFYINNNSDLIQTNRQISDKWVDLNQNESNQFLSQSGFSQIQKTNNGNKEIVVGKIEGDNFVLKRNLIFENNEIKSYVDEIMFIQPCLVCLANKMMAKSRNNYGMGDLFASSLNSAKISDTKVKDDIYTGYSMSLKKDGMNMNTPYVYNQTEIILYDTLDTEDYKTIRYLKMGLDEDDIYEIQVGKAVFINEIEYKIGDIDLKTFNQYDLKAMVELFLIDCKNNGIAIKPNQIKVAFIPLGNNILGVSSGKNKDTQIELKIDPELWANASGPKRWYLIYHELGHDVLNLEHGEGGKMMFPFADKGYSWREFWTDRQYMFNHCK